MTKIIFKITKDHKNRSFYSVIDNHKHEKQTCYDIIYKTQNINDFKKYIKAKGLI